MSIQVIEYIKKNEKKFLGQANMFCRNVEQAEDVLQRVYLYFLENPKTYIEHLDSYIYLTIRSKFYNIIKKQENKKKYTYIEDFDKIFTDDTVEYSNLYTEVETRGILKIIDKVCSVKEKDAIFYTLATDNTTESLDGRNFETTKVNRRLGIKRVRKYLTLE